MLNRAFLEESWEEWLAALFPTTMRDFAPHHRLFWDWVWSIRPGERPPPFVAIWARGAAKSTNLELAIVALGARGIRRYCIYVCATQEQADDHVANIASLLENPNLARLYPGIGSPALNKFGNPKGWRRNRLRCANGFTIDALGLDTSARGAKVDDDRPDIEAYDDVDSETDQPPTVEKKIQQMTRKLLPAGSGDLAVAAVQNVVHEHSVFSRLAGLIEDEKADFLSDRLVSGPHPAIEGASYRQHPDTLEWKIVAGTPTWGGMDIERCEGMIRAMGLTAFRVECQHEVDVLPGGMFDDVTFKYCTWQEIPPLLRVVVWVDPAVTNTDKSDSMGIQCDALGEDGLVYRLFSWEGRTSPEDAIERAIAVAAQFKSDTVGVETDQGGDTWLSVYERALTNLAEKGFVLPHAIGFVERKAGAGYGPKFHRANQMHARYEQGLFVHVTLGTQSVLERALRRFPRAKPYDLVDAAFWSSEDLLGSEVFEYAVGGLQSPLASIVMR